MKKKISCFVLVLMLCLSLAIHVQAEEVVLECNGIEYSFENRNGVLYDKEGPLVGLTEDGQTGTLLDDDLSTLSIKSLFSMTFQDVSTIVRSNNKDSSKYFTRSSLTEGIQINGIVNSTSSETSTARVGVCYYDASLGEYVYPSDTFNNIPISTYSTIYFPKRYISNEWYSYGYVQNWEPYGRLSGTLYFYNSDEG